MRETRIYMCIYLAIIVVAVVAAEDFDTKCPSILRYYEDLGCTPVFLEEYRCPIRYDCNKRNRRRNRCYINNHEYKVNQMLKPEDANVCDNSCSCELGNYDEIAAFECVANEESPNIILKRDCYLRKNPSKCWGDPQEICPGSPDYRAACVVNGKTFMDGEEFYVDEEPDLTCICQPGYQGENVPPFCVRNNHSTCYHPAFIHSDHFGQKCAPVFLNNKLHREGCLLNIRCPSPGKDGWSIDGNFQGEYSWDDKNKCLYGDRILRIGDELRTTTDCISCMCKVPPLLTCEFDCGKKKL